MRGVLSWLALCVALTWGGEAVQAQEGPESPTEGTSSTLNNLFGQVIPLPAPAGQMSFRAVMKLPAPVDLRTSTVRFVSLLNEAGTERAGSLPPVLSPVSGSTRDAATYYSLSNSGISLTLGHLGDGRYAVTFDVFVGAFRLPSSCSIFGGGTAKLTTSFAIESPTTPSATVSTQETWFCTPGGTYMYAL